MDDRSFKGHSVLEVVVIILFERTLCVRSPPDVRKLLHLATRQKMGVDVESLRTKPELLEDRASEIYRRGASRFTKLCPQVPPNHVPRFLQIMLPG